MLLTALKTHKVPVQKAGFEFRKFQPVEVDERGIVRKVADVTDTNQFPNCDPTYWAQKVEAGVVGFEDEASRREYVELMTPFWEDQERKRADQERVNAVVQENRRRALLGIAPMTLEQYQSERSPKPRAKVTA